MHIYDGIKKCFPSEEDAAMTSEMSVWIGSEGATMHSILKFDAFQGLMTIFASECLVFNITVQSLAGEIGCSGLRLSKPYVERDVHVSTTVH